MRKILNFIAIHGIQMTIERTGRRSDSFLITISRNGFYYESFISDWELRDSEEDYLLFVIKGMTHELLEEEQNHLRFAEQFKKRD